MTPTEFRRKWTGHRLTERAAAQQHFLDLCEMLHHSKPAEVDQEGTEFCFEKHVAKTDGGKGFADVWKRGHFGWEYKGPHGNLQAAYKQLLDYREDLENPPLLVVCDTDIIEIHTNFTNTAKKTYTVRLQSIDDPESLAILQKVFVLPNELRPDSTPLIVTEDAARRIGDIAENMRIRDVPPHDAAHFLMRLIFCLFAEDVGLLRKDLMSRMLANNRNNPQGFDGMLRSLLAAMRTGGPFGPDWIDYFDGGLFDDDTTVPLEASELAALSEVAKLDWSCIEPAVFGTLFERSLDPAKRAQLGAHYTSRDDILAIVEPVLMEPLRAEWAGVRDECETLVQKRESIEIRLEHTAAQAASLRRQRNDITREINDRVSAFMARVAKVRVLDPACGSGNFLYVALTLLKDLEREAIRATAAWSAEPPWPAVDPSQLHGLEIDPYAAELAQLTVWIGYLQWMRANGFRNEAKPILKPLHNIEQRDAILAEDQAGNVVEPEWPEADVIVGNPPFLGDKRLRTELGDEYVERLFALYKGEIPNQADLCCYWFERARREIAAGHAKRAGLLATNSIRQRKNRVVLQRIAESGGIFMAWSDREWVLDGAAIRISMVGFDDGSGHGRTLDGNPVPAIHADLTAQVDVTTAQRLSANVGIYSVGTQKNGAFDIPGDLARMMLAAPNPLGRSNADVVKPWVNGMDITHRPRGMWIIDFGADMSEQEAALYEAPFEYVREHVGRLTQRGHDLNAQRRWWLHARPRPEMRAAIGALSRYLATVIVAKHRMFVWVPAAVLPDKRLVVFAREDDYFFGVLHSRAHEKWSLRMGSTLEDRPSYTPSTCFETFPFPQPTDTQREAISEAAKALHEVRQSALDSDPKLTLTALYNKKPTWLQNLHRDLDAAVFAAYGWAPDISDDELLEKLLALNLERAAEEKTGVLRRP